MDFNEYKIPLKFLEENGNFWRGGRSARKYFLVSLLVGDHEYYNLTLVSAKLMGGILGMEPVVLLESPSQTELLKLVESYNINQKLFLSDFKISPALDVRLLARGAWHWLVSRSRRSRLGFRYKGLRIGHCVYDTYLRRGVGTVNLVDPRYARFAWWGLRQYHIYDRIFSQRKFEMFFGSDQLYVGGGIPSLLATSRGIKVWYRTFGPKRVGYRAYNKPEELDIFPGHCDGTDFRKLWQNYREQALAWSNTYLSNLFAGVIDHGYRDAIPAYGTSRQLTAAEQAEFFETKHKKKVFVFAHVFVDAAHLYREGLFEDYEVWLRTTLSVASRRKDTLWIVKPHPGEKGFFLRTKARDVIKDFLHHDNIKIFPEGASTAAVVHKMDGLITVRGTAAVEYASMGVPVVTAGRNMFDEADFEIEPASMEEYCQVLLTNPFDRLPEEKMARAKVCLYLYNCVNRVDLPLFETFRQDTDIRIQPDIIYDYLARVLPERNLEDLVTTEYKNYVLRKFNRQPL